MIVRSIKQSDYEMIKQIYINHFDKEFEFPDFVTHYLNAFVVTDDDDNIVSVAGVKTIAEIVAMTDMTRSPRIRREALDKVQIYSNIIMKDNGYEQLHALSHDPKWSSVLKKNGFIQHPGEWLIW